LQPSLKIGDLVIPTHAIPEEGTSPHYPTSPENPPSDAGLNRILETALKEIKTPFTKGPIWTTDAIYRETPEKVTAYQQQNILAVEMEVSALLAVSSFRSVQLAALLVVSDELSQLKWVPGFSSSLLKERSRVAAELLLAAHVRLGQPENLPGEIK
jgi:purine-nucleoside phosphorylase